MKAAIVAAAIGVCAGWVSSSTAAPITFFFTGAVTQTNFDPEDPFAGSIVFGTTFSGSFSFESTATDGTPDASTGSWTSPAGAPYRLMVTIGGSVFTATDFLNVGLTDDLPGPLDQYTVLACVTSCADFAIEIQFGDTDATVFDGVALPLDAPTFGEFEVVNFAVRGDVQGNQVEILGRLTSLVPEPSTGVLCTMALAALGRCRRLRRSTIQGEGS
jgi:hypothetical protein